MGKIQRPTERDLSDAEPAYTKFDWKLQDKRFPTTIQATQDYPRNARGFIVEDEVWFDQIPPHQHEQWRNEIIQENYDRHWQDPEPNQILYFKITGPNEFQVPFPRYKDVTDEAFLRMCHFIKYFEVPRDVEVTWAISDVGILRHPAGDYIDLV